MKTFSIVLLALLALFSFNFIKGDPVKELAEPNKAFISQTTAQKYFGNQDPLGKIISVDKKYDYLIAGVFEDIPDNSHLKFDLLLPWKNLETQFGPDYYENWGHSGSFTYILLKQNVELASFENKLRELVNKECGEFLKQYNMNNWKKTFNNIIGFTLVYLWVVSFFVFVLYVLAKIYLKENY